MFYIGDLLLGRDSMRELTGLQIAGVGVLVSAAALMLLSTKFKKYKLAGKLVSLALAFIGAVMVFI